MTGVDVYSVGIISLSACAPASMSLAKVTEEVNRQVPTGIESRWTPDPAPSFRTGSPNPHQCERDSERTHYLFQC